MSGELPLSVYSSSSSLSQDDLMADPGNGDFTMTRSEEMQFVNITIPNELVTETVNALGDFGLLHIVDLSGSTEMSKHQFAYKKRTTDVADIEKKLDSFEDQMKKRNIKIPFADFDTPLGNFAELAYQRNPDVVLGAADFAAEYDSQLTSNLAFERSVQVELARRQELRLTLMESDKLIPEGATQSGDVESGAASHTYDRFMASVNNQHADRDGNGISSYICGVIPVQHQAVFTRLVYRTARGSNAVVKFSPSPTTMKDPTTGEDVAKVVFCLVTIGSQLYRRMMKICPLVGATVYPVPSGQPALVADEISHLDSELREQQQALEQTSSTIARILAVLAQPQTLSGAYGPCPLRMWQQVLFRERLMIDVLMKCEFHQTLVFMGGWCPVNKLEDLAYTLNFASQGSGAKPALDRNAVAPKNFPTPPSLLPGNKFTSPFQGVVNTYGIPRYLEFNPGLFTIVTFPFLFGVMFGDVFHGSAILIIGLLLIIMEKKFDEMKRQKTMNEMIDMLYGGRYIIFLMGCFAIYCGTIYNDVMSLPINLYGSNYSLTEVDGEAAYVWNNEVYPWGMDPNWYHVNNSLKFFNSFKMKMSVVIGVIHMTFGIFISLYNHLFFKDHLAIVMEFIPRLLFLTCTFGYMITMIIIKWCTDWTDRNPPNLIQTMIDLFLSPGSVEESSLLYEGQPIVQLVCLLVAVACIPWMLCPKPIIEFNKRAGNCPSMAFLHSPADDHYQASKRARKSSDADNLALSQHVHDHNDSDSESEGGAHDEDGPHHTLGDDMIHQSIHTIEFVLGAVSNTASYLRLWALSLAHAQLAEVFWDKMMSEYGFEQSGFFCFLGTGVFAAASFSIIIAMSATEAFLHTLRLHWVEWQNKFFAADGYLFTPFNFIVSDED